MNHCSFAINFPEFLAALSDQLIAEAMLPGLKCLKVDMEAVELEHTEVVNAMVRELTARLDQRYDIYCIPGIFRKRVFFGIFGIFENIPKITHF